MCNAHLVDRMGYNQESTIGERTSQNVLIFNTINIFIKHWTMVDGADVNLCMQLPNDRSDNSPK